jgi:hypothetical protein
MTQSKAASDYARKLAAAHAEAQAAGMARWQYDDWFARHLRKLWVRIRPEPYHHLGWIWARFFAFMALIFSNWLCGGWADELSTFRLVLTTVGVSALLATIRMLVTKADRRKHRLTPWSEL